MRNPATLGSVAHDGMQGNRLASLPDGTGGIARYADRAVRARQHQVGYARAESCDNKTAGTGNPLTFFLASRTACFLFALSFICGMRS